MQKVRYELDPHNRLVVTGAGRENDLPKFRRVLDGSFKTDEYNNLSYHIKSPLSKDGHIPHQLKIKGEWSLTDNHELCLTLDKWGRKTFGDQITLQGEILDADKNSLLFAITTTTKKGTQSTYVLNLSGSWKADKFNRLSFYIKKEKGEYDILTFNGIWQVNKNHQIIYRYEKALFLRKKREAHTLAFKGYWDIKDAFRISYVLSKSTDSAFEFRGCAGIFKEGYIKYEIGIGLANRAAPVTQTLTLSGRWSLKREVGLVFEIEYDNKRTGAIVFGADVRLTDKDTLSFRLKDNTEDKDMGVTLELSHKILKGDGEAFIRALRSDRESAFYAGTAWKW